MTSRDDGPAGVPGTWQPNALQELKILVPTDLYRAWQRCTWVIVSETGCSRTEIMAEMVRDFLVKHGC